MVGSTTVVEDIDRILPRSLEMVELGNNCQGKTMDEDTKSTLMISDLSVAEPASALADRPLENAWQKMDYELHDGTRGVMLTADPHYQAPEIVIPLNERGTFRIFVGVNYFFQTQDRLLWD